MGSNRFEISVIGAGVWGTSLAMLLANNGSSVQLWCHEPETTKSIRQNHVNTSFLLNVPLPKSLGATDDLLEVARNTRILIANPPSHFTREIAKKMCSKITDEHILVILSKGIELHSLALMSEIYTEELDNLPILAFLSGPIFARKVVLDLPPAVILAYEDEKTGGLLQRYFHSDRFRSLQYW